MVSRDGHIGEGPLGQLRALPAHQEGKRSGRHRNRDVQTRSSDAAGPHGTEGQRGSAGGAIHCSIDNGGRATRIVQYVPAVTQRAEESAHAVITRWMPIMGLPEHVTSDSHSGFASNTFATVLKMLGVQKHKLQPREAKGGVAIVERKHLPLNQVLADGFATGNIVDAKSFELYVALITVRSTQVARPGHSRPV